MVPSTKAEYGTLDLKIGFEFAEVVFFCWKRPRRSLAEIVAATYAFFLRPGLATFGAIWPTTADDTFSSVDLDSAMAVCISSSNLLQKKKNVSFCLHHQNFNKTSISK